MPGYLDAEMKERIPNSRSYSEKKKYFGRLLEEEVAVVVLSLSLLMKTVD